MFLALIGISAGMVVAGGVFSFIVELGVISDFADRTHTAKHILFYEDMVSAGAVCVSFYDQGSGKGSRRTDPECRTFAGFRMFQLSGKRTCSGTDLFIFVFLYAGL